VSSNSCLDLEFLVATNAEATNVSRSVNTMRFRSLTPSDQSLHTYICVDMMCRDKIAPSGNFSVPGWCLGGVNCQFILFPHSTPTRYSLKKESFLRRV
jgi:hypothetical protein